MRALNLIPRVTPLLLVVVLLGAWSYVSATPIYKSEDPDGTVVFSSKPPVKGAAPAELPPIMRGEVKLPKSDLVSCATHGGVNCKSGADTDGSVICYDGFRGATARFRFSCNTPKLEISDISELGNDGSVTVFVRNARAVAASGVVLTYRPPRGTTIPLEGPREIEPFGIAEFSLKARPDNPIAEKPDLGALELSCGNCLN